MDSLLLPQAPLLAVLVLVYTRLRMRRVRAVLRSERDRPAAVG